MDTLKLPLLHRCFAKAWVDQQQLCSSNSYHILYKQDVKHLALVLIFKFSCSISHLYQADGTQNSMPSQMLQRYMQLVQTSASTILISFCKRTVRTSFCSQLATVILLSNYLQSGLYGQCDKCV